MKSKRATVLVLLTVVLCAASVYAQQRPKVVAFGSDSPERGTTRVGYWDNEKNHGLAQFAIDYGRPIWKKDYEDADKFDKMTKGQVYRLGSNFWTTLDSDIPLTIAGKKVAAGHWYLGLHRSDDGATWSLCIIDPAKVRAAHLDASEIGNAPVDQKIPMTSEAASETREKLTIDLQFKRENLNDVTLKIAWGKLQLSAPIKVAVGS